MVDNSQVFMSNWDITSRQPYLHAWSWLKMPQASTTLRSCKPISPFTWWDGYENRSKIIFWDAPTNAFAAPKHMMHSENQTAEQNLRAQVIEDVQTKFTKKKKKKRWSRGVFFLFAWGINRELKQLYTPYPLCCREACYDELDSSLWNRCTLLEIFAWSSWHEPFCCKVLVFFCGRNKKSSVSKT